MRFWNEIARGRKHRRANDSAKDSRQNPGRDERRKIGRESAAKRAQSQSRIQRENGDAPIETVEKKSRRQPGETGAKGIGGNHKAKLARRNRENPHELRTQRHHDQKVDDVGELNRGEHSQHEPEPAR